MINSWDLVAISQVYSWDLYVLRISLHSQLQNCNCECKLILFLYYRVNNLKISTILKLQNTCKHVLMAYCSQTPMFTFYFCINKMSHQYQFKFSQDRGKKFKKPLQWKYSVILQEYFNRLRQNWSKKNTHEQLSCLGCQIFFGQLKALLDLPINFFQVAIMHG